MIRLTRLGGAAEPLYLNPDLIERLDAHHDTTVHLTSGAEHVVTESPEEIVTRIVQLRATVIAVAQRLTNDPSVTVTATMRTPLALVGATEVVADGQPIDDQPIDAPVAAVADTEV